MIKLDHEQFLPPGNNRKRTVSIGSEVFNTPGNTHSLLTQPMKRIAGTSGSVVS
jgi:hypothetical protein